MSDAEGSSTPLPNDNGRSSRTARRPSILGLLLLAPFFCIVVWECGHRVRFGDFFTYGYHTDLVEDHSDIGVPRLRTAYCLRVTNYTFSPLKFEAIQTPDFGVFDGQVVFHDGIEKWDKETRSWQTVGDSLKADEPRLGKPNTTKNVWPGRSIYPTGCYEIAGIEGIHKGDTVRIVAFTSFSEGKGTPGQIALYSPTFTVKEQSSRKESDLSSSQKLRAD